MMRRIVGAIALAAVVTTGAQAQFQANFSATPGAVGGSTDFAAYFGTFNATGSPGSNPAQTGIANATVFQIFCVDETHFFSNGDTYQVWVTPMSSSDFSHTRKGNAFSAQYFQAANLASNMQFAYPGGPDNVKTDNLQYAMWSVLGYPTPPPLSEDPTSDYCASTLTVDCTGYDLLHRTSGQGIFANQWLVITAFDLQNHQEQEFIYNGPGRPREVVPEPGTMALLAMGLVGMAGAGMRRRKK